jgi:RND family efflux transporter MFP subunit
MSEPTKAPDEKKPLPIRRGGLLLIPGLLFLSAALTAIAHHRSRARLAAVTNSLKPVNVAVIRAEPGGAAAVLTLPATMQAFSQSLIYARVSGYLRHWYADIGDHVAKGKLLATIDAPEVDQQVLAARAVLTQAQANLALAAVTSARYQELIKSHAVSQQEADTYLQDFVAQKANVRAAEATLKGLEQMQGFEKVYAPYDGVITERKTEVGDLVNAGNAGSKQELFRLSQIDTIRVYVTVPEAHSQEVVLGSSATVFVTELPGMQFTGTVVRTNKAIDPNSRTTLTELDVDNSSGTILPGAFAEVRFQLPVPSGLIVLPTSSVLFQAAGPQVGVVNGRNQVELRKVALGWDYGNTVEVLSGVRPNDMVIASPPDYLVDGMTVAVQTSTATPASSTR